MTNGERTEAICEAAHKSRTSYGRFVSLHTEKELQKLYAPYMRRKKERERKERQRIDIIDAFRHSKQKERR